MAIAKARRSSTSGFGGISRSLGKALSLRNGSRFAAPDTELMHVTSSVVSPLKLQPMSNLDLMIQNGYGNTPQSRLPADWRTRKRNGTNA